VAFQLIGISQNTSGIAFDIPPGSSTVGRQADRTLVLDATDVSRVHARFNQSGASLRLYDLNSTNGTRLNGKPVTQAEVQHGDEISFGKQLFRVAAIRNGKWRS
jgi:pSer/pThr/pTyr-binding forkhead associated (FHA) protein